MKDVVYNVTTGSMYKDEDFGLLPYDSFGRMMYYIFENNKRLKYRQTHRFKNLMMMLQPVAYDKPPHNKILFKIRKPTVEFMNSCHRFLSAKNTTYYTGSTGAFNDISTFSQGVWIGLVCSFALLTLVEIIQRRMNGIRSSIVSFAFKKVFLYFGAILGKGFDIPASLAVRICVGLFILQIVVFVTLLNGVMKSNYFTTRIENVNTVADFMRVPNVFGDPEHMSHVCKSKNTEIITLCEFVDRNGARKLERNILTDPYVAFLDLETIMLAMESEGPMFNNRLHLGSAEYLCEPKVFMTFPTLPPEALKIINRRLRSLVETSQETPWLRSIERHFGVNEQGSENEVQEITWKGIRIAFVIWAEMLAVASVVAAFELLTMIPFQSQNTRRQIFPV